jgi:hypothetical protein
MLLIGQSHRMVRSCATKISDMTRTIQFNVEVRGRRSEVEGTASAACSSLSTAVLGAFSTMKKSSCWRKPDDLHQL